MRASELEGDPESSESPVPPDARLSAALGLASVVTAGAAAAAFAGTAATGRATEIAGTGTGGPFGAPATLATAPVAGVAKSSVGDDDKSAV
jgi:hypothetical protein